MPSRPVPPVRPSPDAFTAFLRQETTGGVLLLAATAIALVWANVAGDDYAAFWSTTPLRVPALHLELDLAHWAADGLLAVFFLVAGMEVKRELLAGELADRRAAALPVVAALGGMAAPAAVAIAWSGGAALDGGAWAIPVATDIAFALGVLALAGAGLPPGVRAFLLSLAVIDDLVAIALIAVLFSGGIGLGWLALGAACCGAYGLALRDGRVPAAVIVVLGIATWVCVHASGVHATVAGVLLGLATPLDRIDAVLHRTHPVSAGVCVPLFALASTGIAVGAVGDATGDAVAMGVFAGLLLGKFVGIYGGARLAVAVRIGRLPDGVVWADVVPLALLGGIGYTVSLLIAGLAFDDAGAQERAAAAVLCASVVASAGAVVLLRRRARAVRRAGGRADDGASVASL